MLRTYRKLLPKIVALASLLALGGCGGSGDNSSLRPAGIPDAPVGVKATAGDAQVIVSWSAVPGAGNYKVYRDGALVGTPKNDLYSDGNLTNETTYSYQVSAVNAVGEGAKSAMVTARPHAQLPAAPTGLNAAPGDMQVALNWDPVAGATSYAVYRDGTRVGTPTNAMFSDTGLINGTTYQYQVSAVDAEGEGAKSTSVNATPQAPGGGKPGPSNTGVPPARRSLS